MRAVALLAAGVVVIANSAWSQSLPASDQGSASGGLQEVVITAQRRAENIQTTPISVTAVTSETIQDFGMRDFTDYAKVVPNVSFGMGGSPYGGVAYGYSSTRQIVIRGVSGSDTTSLYIDDTPIPNVIDPRVLDLSRIEVLRGPQGTLFGASSMGGTVRLITATPDLNNASGRIDAQGFDVDAAGAGYDVSGALNMPLVADNAAIHLSAFDTATPSWFNRIYGLPVVPGVAFQPGEQVMGSTKVGANHTYGGMASVLVKPEALPGLTITPMVMLQRSDTNGYPVAEGSADDFNQLRALNAPESTGDQWQFYALTAKYAASFGTFVSASSYLHRYAADDEDGTTYTALYQCFYYCPLPYLAAPTPQSYDTKQTTQELRFESQFRGPVQFVAGYFFQRSALTYAYSALVPGIDALSGGYLGTDDLYQDNERTLLKQNAGFIDVTYSVTHEFELSAGVRKAWLNYSGWEAVEQPPVFDANSYFNFLEKEQPVTPRFVAKYSFDQNDIVYASASKGFRIGGSSPPTTGACQSGAESLGIPIGEPIPYHSDSLWSYELGIKNMWDDSRISTRVAAYHISWDNIQQSLLLPVCGVSVELNAGAARINGAEGELLAQLTPSFNLNASAGYEDAKITQATLLPGGTVLGFPVGTPLSGVPKWTAALRGEYTTAVNNIGEAFIRAEYNFVGTSLSLANGGAGLYRNEYSLVDLRTGIRTGNWTTTLFAKNLFNKAANYGDLVSDVGLVPGSPRIVVSQPRTVGLEVALQFGGH